MALAGTRPARVSSGDLPFIDAVEDMADASSRRSSQADGEAAQGGSRRASQQLQPGAVPSRRSSREEGEARAASRRSSRSPAPIGEEPSDGGARGHVRRPSHVPLPTITTTASEGSGAELTAGSQSEAAGAATEGEAEGSRRDSGAQGSREASRRSSRALLDPDYLGSRRSSSRRSSNALDLAEVVLAELRRPTRRSSRAIALDLGEIVSVEVRRESRASSRGSTVEEVRATVRRDSQASSKRPSLFTQRGSASLLHSQDEEEDDEDEDEDEDDGDEKKGAESLRSSLGQGSRIPQFVSAFVVNLAAFVNGVTFSWPAVALPLLQSDLSPIHGGPLSAETGSWLAAVICVSAGLSSPAWIVIIDRYGRKNTGYLLGLAFALHWVLLGVTRNLTCLFVARVFGGLGAGGCFVLCPAYVNEISEPSIRGELGVFFAMMFNLGVVVTYIVGAVMSYKGVNILGMAFVLFFILAFWQLPESPVYLLSKGRTSRAGRALQWLRGNGADVIDELTEMRKANRRRRQEGDSTFFEVLSDKASFKGIVVTSLLCANQALCGIIVMLSFAVSIFMEAGDAISPNMASIIVSLLLLVSSYASSHLIDRLGRRPMLMISNVGMAVCLGSQGLYFFIKHLGIDVNSLHLGWLPVTSLSLFMVFVSLGVGPIPFIVLTEMFLPQAQKIAVVTGYAIIWSLSFVSVKFFTNIANAIGVFSCYWIFGGVCSLMCVYVYFCLPETKDRPLESILEELAGVRKPKVAIEESKTLVEENHTNNVAV